MGNNDKKITSIKYDALKMYYAEDYFVTDKIYIKCPTIGQILEYGEPMFYNMIFLLCANPTSLRLSLWEQGINWNDVDEYELFISIVRGFEKKETEILFGDLDFTKFMPIQDDKNEIVLVYLDDNSIYIDRDIGIKIVSYLRTLFDIHPKVERAKGRATAELIIDEEKMNLKLKEKEESDSPSYFESSFLFPLISTMLNHPGFKYTKTELINCGIFEFMDSVKRIQSYESVTSLMTGMYMGMIDTSKIDMKTELNLMRDLYSD